MGEQGLEVRAMPRPGQLLRVQCHLSVPWGLHMDFDKSYMDFDGGVGRAPP